MMDISLPKKLMNICHEEDSTRYLPATNLMYRQEMGLWINDVQVTII
jgi:hypothetical protein